MSGLFVNNSRLIHGSGLVTSHPKHDFMSIKSTNEYIPQKESFLSNHDN